MSVIKPKDYIPDWYRCPICNKECYGFMSWAGHTGTEHKIDCITFEQKIGVWKSFFGTGWKFYKNNKEIEIDDREKVEFT